MVNVDEIIVFLGWCTAINLGVYILSALFIFGFKNFTINIHSKISGVKSSELPHLYFNYLGNYKIGILLFNLTPYIALKLMF